VVVVDAIEVDGAAVVEESVAPLVVEGMVTDGSVVGVMPGETPSPVEQPATMSAARTTMAAGTRVFLQIMGRG